MKGNLKADIEGSGAESRKCELIKTKRGAKLEASSRKPDLEYGPKVCRLLNRKNDCVTFSESGNANILKNGLSGCAKTVRNCIVLQGIFVAVGENG